MKPRDRQALRLGVHVALIGVVGLRVLPFAVREARAAEATLLARGAELGALQAEAGSLAGLEDSARAVRTALVGLAPSLLEGRTSVAAAGALSVRVAAVADRNRVRVMRTEPLPDSTRVGTLGRVRVRVQLESDSPGLVGALVGIADDPAALRVTELRLTALSPLSGPEVPEILRAEMTVMGWFVAGGEP